MTQFKLKKLTRQDGFGAVEILLVIVLIALVAGVGWYVWQTNQKKAVTTQTTTTTQQTTAQPAGTAVDEEHYSITLPEGWNKVEATQSSAQAKLYTYQDKNGNYFKVAVDPVGGGFTGNATWWYKPVNDKTFEVTKEIPCDGDMCTKNDSKYDVLVKMSDELTYAKVKGHYYSFFAGNTTKASGDNAAYKALVQAIVLK